MAKSKDPDPVGAIEGSPRSRTTPASPAVPAQPRDDERADGGKRFSDFDEAGYERRDWLDAERARKATQAREAGTAGEPGEAPAGGVHAEPIDAPSAPGAPSEAGPKR